MFIYKGRPVSPQEVADILKNRHRIAKAEHQRDMDADAVKQQRRNMVVNGLVLLAFALAISPLIVAVLT